MKPAAAKHRAVKSRPAHVTGSQILGITRQGLCTIALAASLSAAATVGSPTAGAGESVPGPASPQALQRGDGRLDLPALKVTTDPKISAVDGKHGIAATALDAYKSAADAVKAGHPRCRLPWELLAGIGRVESVHASGYGLSDDGSTQKPIRGPRLDGIQFALIRDTESGKWDGDTVYDRAVGPMQFIPSTWASWGADGNGDRTRDPNNLYDAALGAGLYLCAGGRDVSTTTDLDKAVLSYNNSREYANTVIGWMRIYQEGTKEIPDPAGTKEGSRPSTLRREGSPATTEPGSGTTPGPAATTSTPHKPPPSKPQPESSPTPSQPNPNKPAISTPGPTAVTRLERIGSDRLVAHAETEFASRPQVRAVSANGKPAAGVKIVYAIVGATQARFPSGTARVTVTTNADGIATTPRIHAGPTPGAFMINATLKHLPPVAFYASVESRATPVADQLTCTSDALLATETGNAFPERIEIQATTTGGRLVAGTEITATLLDDLAHGSSPYFLTDDGKPVLTLTLPPTGPDGLIRLPEIYAGDHPGTYILRLTTPENVSLDLALTVH